MAKRFTFSMSAAAAWDGNTAFVMPNPLPAPDPNTGVTTISMTTAAGQIDPASLSLSIGVGGAKVTCVGLLSTSAAARIAIAFLQPRPGVDYGGNLMFQNIALSTFVVAGSVVRPLSRESMYMPPGYVLALFADNGGGVAVVGPYSVTLEFEPLSGVAEVCGALKGQDFPLSPMLLA